MYEKNNNIYITHFKICSFSKLKKSNKMITILMVGVFLIFFYILI